MIMNGEAAFGSDSSLPMFDFFIKKFFYMTTLDTHQMVVVIANIEFINRFVTIEMVPDQQAGLLKLG